MYIAGILSHSIYTKKEPLNEPFQITTEFGKYYLKGNNFKKELHEQGELGSIYERMEGLLKEHPLELRLNFERLQSSITADSTQSRD